MNYSWKIQEMFKMDQTNQDGVVLQDAVVRVSWSKIGTNDDGVQASYLGKSQFTAENILASEFVNFESLTEEQVIEWVKGSTSAADETMINKVIQEKIDNSTATKASTLPWS